MSQLALISSLYSLAFTFLVFVQPIYNLYQYLNILSLRYRQLKQQYELKVEEEQILQAKLQQSSFHQQQEELERLRKAIGQNTIQNNRIAEIENCSENPSNLL